MNEQLNCPSSPNLSLAIGLNNEGAQLIRRGCYDDAVSTLLLDAVHHFRDGQELLLSGMQSFPCMLQRRHGPSCRLASNKTSTAAAQHDLPRGELLRTGDYIYREPVVLDVDGSAIVEPRMIQLSIIFNFALSRHLKALSGIPSRQEKRLRSALKLYNWVLSLERTYKDDDESSLGLLPCLGIINNTAQIHRQLHKNEKADKMFGILLTSLMLVKARGDDVQVEQLAGFYSATSYLILKRSHVARAA